MTHKTWREFSQEKPSDTHFNSRLWFSLVLVSDLIKMNHNTNIENAYTTFHTCDHHLRVSSHFTETLQSLDNKLIISSGPSK